MMNDSNLSKVWSLGYMGQITTGEAINCAINITEAAMKHYKITEIAELTPKRQQNLRAMVDRMLDELGIKHILWEWWEDHDWTELSA